VTRISGPTLERARQAVEVLRQSEDPELSLMGLVDAAVVRLIVEVETRYPELRYLSWLQLFIDDLDGSEKRTLPGDAVGKVDGAEDSATSGADAMSTTATTKKRPASTATTRKVCVLSEVMRSVSQWWRGGGRLIMAA
jgi:hypothetical protein